MAVPFQSPLSKFISDWDGGNRRDFHRVDVRSVDLFSTLESIMRTLKVVDPSALWNRIRENIDIIDGGHWLWRGPFDKSGLPKLRWGRKRSVVSFAWIVHEGGLDLRFTVKAQCEYMACVNPSHAHLIKKAKVPKGNGVCWLEKKGSSGKAKKQTKKQRLAFKVRLKKGALALAKKAGREKLTQNDMYVAYLRTPEWRAKRSASLKETGGLCAFCNTKAKAVHHVMYRRLGSESVRDLVPVCDRHHTVLHGKMSADMSSDSGLCIFCGEGANMLHQIKYPKKIGGEEPCASVPVCVRCGRVASGDVSISPNYCPPLAPVPRDSSKKAIDKHHKETEILTRKKITQVRKEEKKVARLLAASRKRIAVEAAQKEIRAESRRLG